jgi:hypothetical protein
VNDNRVNDAKAASRIQADSRYQGGGASTKPVFRESSSTLAGTALLAEVGSVELAASAISISLAIRQTMIPRPPARRANAAKAIDQSPPWAFTAKAGSNRNG